MNIFFTASIHSLENSKKRYVSLRDHLKKAGHILNTSHVIKSENEGDEDGDKYQEIISEIKRCDALFADTSFPSFSVGYFVSLALQYDKPVIIVFIGNKENEPHIFRQLEKNTDKVMIFRYDDGYDIEKDVASMIEFVNSVQDTRFNFFVSPELSSYLDWIAKSKKIPRSVYLRELIEKDMVHQNHSE